MPGLTHVVTYKRSGIIHRCVDAYCWHPRCRPEGFYLTDVAHWKTDYVESLEGLRLCKKCWPRGVR